MAAKMLTKCAQKTDGPLLLARAVLGPGAEPSPTEENGARSMPDLRIHLVVLNPSDGGESHKL